MRGERNMSGKESVQAMVKFMSGLLLVGALCLIVGFTLMHHIGGFIHTVEEEAREIALQKLDFVGLRDKAET